MSDGGSFSNQILVLKEVQTKLLPNGRTNQTPFSRKCKLDPYMSTVVCLHSKGSLCRNGAEVVYATVFVALSWIVCLRFKQLPSIFEGTLCELR